MSGAVGVTTLLGEWDFSSDEAPYGDKVWTPARHVPTCTLYLDRPQKVVALWPILDEVTAEHGIVTSQFVPAYRERVGELVQGALDLAEQTSFRPPKQDDRPQDSTSTLGAAEPPPTDPVAYSEEERWLRTFANGAAEFARSRGRHEPIVRITLADGEQFLFASAEPGPGGGFVTLYPHPTLYDDLVETIRGPLAAPRALIVPLTSITKIELLKKVPRGTRSLLGFHLPSEQ